MAQPSAHAAPRLRSHAAHPCITLQGIGTNGWHHKHARLSTVSMPFSRTLRDGGDLYDPLASIAPKLSPNGLSPDTFFQAVPRWLTPTASDPRRRWQAWTRTTRCASNLCYRANPSHAALCQAIPPCPGIVYEEDLANEEEGPFMVAQEEVCHLR